MSYNINEINIMSRWLYQCFFLCFGLLYAGSNLLAQPVAKELQFKEQRFKDWSINCSKQESTDKQSCLLLQTIVLKETNSRLLQVAISKQGKEIIARITIPLGVFLPAGLSWQIDKAEKTNYAILYCDQQGCHSTIRLDKKMLTTLKAGNQLTVTFADLNRRSIGVPVSLLGFTVGFKALD